MTHDTEEPSAASDGSADFDARVAAIRAIGVRPQHKPYGKNKTDCTPVQWASHLEWRAVYYSERKEEWNMYRNRWAAKKR